MIFPALAQDWVDLPISTRLVTLESKNYMLLNPEFVATGVERYHWSPDGSVLFAITADPRREPNQPSDMSRDTIITFWSTKTRKSTGSFKLPANSRILEDHWEGPSGNAIISLGDSTGIQTAILRIESNGRATALRGVGKELGISVSKKQGGILVAIKDQLRFYPAGEVESIPIQSPPGYRLESFYYGLDFGGRYVPIGEGRNAKGVLFLYDPSKSDFVKTESATPTITEVYTQSGDSSVRTPGTLKAIGLKSAWIRGDEKSKYPSALLSPNSLGGALHLTTLNTAYVENGNLFVRRLQPIEQAQIDDMLECEEMRKLLAETKQVATSLAIYLDDNDDHFPLPVNFKEAIMPYLRSEELFRGFTPTYRAGLKSEDIKDNATEVIGFKEGAYGRAVAYADTHVVWVSNKPKERKGCAP